MCDHVSDSDECVCVTHPRVYMCSCKMFPDVEAGSSTTTMVIAAATNKA